MTRTELTEWFLSVRRTTEQLCAPLEIEDYVVQPIVDVSPPKWHLGHTSWFFETFVLQPYCSGYTPFHPLYGFLFNSYYNSVGARTARHQRGHLSRPTVREIYAYRNAITEQVLDLIAQLDEAHWHDAAAIIELGIHHEQQHQELLLTDIKYILFTNPLRPAYLSPDTFASLPSASSHSDVPERYVEVPAGVYCIGHCGDGFCFDNELPHHKVYIGDLRFMTRLVTNGEFLEFVESGGYDDFRHWLSDGWDIVQREHWRAPLYWENLDGQWFEFTLYGRVPLRKEAPVTHISYYEAEAFASWKGKRLPTEFEWEVAATLLQASAEHGNFLESGYLMPMPARVTSEPLQQMLGDVWEWTASAYLPYPNYQKAAGAIGEYNGKFMSNQMVLRGGSCVTPKSHIRTTYRNFFQPDKRWQFSGVRLADKL